MSIAISVDTLKEAGVWIEDLGRALCDPSSEECRLEVGQFLTELFSMEREEVERVGCRLYELPLPQKIQLALMARATGAELVEEFLDRLKKGEGGR